MTTSVSARHPVMRSARLDLAAAVLDDPSLLPSGVSARTCTVLIRLAIERALDDFWTRNLPELGKASRRAQILVFSRRVNADIGRRYHQLWSELSRAAHHHAYELTPTAGELRAWHHEAVAVVAALRRMQPPGPAPAPRSAAPS